ncbi:quinone-dependent dihydroorotate dehydrogenase [Parenemella sanctibonifatiensis]|uniref:Dihydroorotate dehydrogenase (quinone) n=1 Tax=Parenemella sanctibonifatiensis TaxID=2016505 RepID=A0A255EN68_9ACTN|nr:quinone-dependent dihydroorotate dehydrogenase [Parenemella sanctibonifatiensis]OYN91055.1 dihydroorotate dehydrogenase (quinone) [Parenemella sanctibonifatiensis]
MSAWQRAGVGLERLGYHHAVRPWLFEGHDDPEDAHLATLDLLRHTALTSWGRLALRTGAGRRTPITVGGVEFPGRIGLAAGADKNGVAAPAWGLLGLGFAEFGTVTPRPQPGNPKPRSHRLLDSAALVNSMGFNNAGATALAERLSLLGAQRGNGALGLAVGISLGKNKDTDLADAPQDYVAGLQAVHQVADYVAINVSSPNTPGLLGLLEPRDLTRLLVRLREAAEELAAGSPGGHPPMPIWLKLSPDLSDRGVREAVALAEEHGVSGIIATNTTIARESLAPADQDRGAALPGGVSGSPLTRRAREVVGLVAVSSHLPVMASGGVMTPGDVAAMFDNGAALVQLYTGLVYNGPALIGAANEMARVHG